MADNEDNKLILDRKDYFLEQIHEAITGFNRWVTGVALKKDPTNEETMEHYCKYGGADDFAKKHVIKDVMEAREKEQKNINRQS